MLTGVALFDGEEEREVFDKILHKSLDFNLYFPDMAECESTFLELLLERDPRSRLGCVPEREEFIMFHDFFMNSAFKANFPPTDWEAMRGKKIDPPYKPSFQAREIIKRAKKGGQVNTPELCDSTTVSLRQRDLFKGFSFTNDKFDD